MEVLYQNLLNLEWKLVLMWVIGGVLIYLAIAKEMEPALLLPMGFGAILVNLPATEGGVRQVLDALFSIGIAGAELFPLMLFIGIGAMIDFQPLLCSPKLMLFGAAAQFGIFFTLALASLLGYDLRDAASRISKPSSDARARVKKMPNWAAAPKSISLGLHSRG